MTTPTGPAPHSIPEAPSHKAGQEVSTQINPDRVSQTMAADLRALGKAFSEQTESEKKFMELATAAEAMAGHDDDCPMRKGKDCSCRDNVRALDKEELPHLEEKRVEWDVSTWRKPSVREAQEKPGVRSIEVKKRQVATLVRVDDGKVVTKLIPDPVAPHSKKLIEVEEQLPPRWVCSDCARSMRSVTADAISHRCDDADLQKANAPVALARSIPADVRFGGAYRLTIWRDRQGEYHLGEEVVVNGKVLEERAIAGPESFDTIEGAVLDAAVNKLAP